MLRCGVDRPEGRGQQRYTGLLRVGRRREDLRCASGAVRADEVAVAERDGCLSERVELLVRRKRPASGHDGRVGKAAALLQVDLLLVQAGDDIRINTELAVFRVDAGLALLRRVGADDVLNAQVDSVDRSTGVGGQTGRADLVRGVDEVIPGPAGVGNVDASLLEDVRVDEGCRGVAAGRQSVELAVDDGAGRGERRVLVDVRQLRDSAEVEQCTDRAVLLGLGATESEHVRSGIAAAAEVGGETVEEVVGAADGSLLHGDVRVLCLEQVDDLAEECRAVVVAPPGDLESDLLLGVEGVGVCCRLFSCGASREDECRGEC